MSTVNTNSSPVDTAQPRLTYLIKRVELALRTKVDAVARSRDLTTSQYAALSVLLQQPGISSAELARLSFVSAQAMNQIVFALEEKDLVMRAPDATHGRVMKTYLTGKGAELLADCDVEVDALEAEMTQYLSRKEAEAFRKFLRECYRGLK